MKSALIDKDAVHGVITLLLEAEAAVGESSDGPVTTAAPALRVIDAFLVPKFRYDPIKKLFLEYVWLVCPLCLVFVCVFVCLLACLGPTSFLLCLLMLENHYNKCLCLNFIKLPWFCESQDSVFGYRHRTRIWGAQFGQMETFLPVCSTTKIIYLFFQKKRKKKKEGFSQKPNVDLSFEESSDCSSRMGFLTLCLG